MHPRIAARAAEISRSRHATLLGRLDFLVAQLTSVYELSTSHLFHIGELAARYQVIRERLAEANIPPQKMGELEEQLVVEFELVGDRILWPLFDALKHVEQRGIGRAGAA